MPMGVLAMLGWFYHVLNSMLDASEVDVASVFLDNITVGGTVTNWC